ncbi:hypothetical protein [Bradyrhizobium sp. RDM12]
MVRSAVFRRVSNHEGWHFRFFKTSHAAGSRSIGLLSMLKRLNSVGGPHDDVGSRDGFVERADRIVRLRQVERGADLLSRLVEVVLVVACRLERIRRAPHFLEIAAGGEFEDVEPIGAGDYELDERLEAVGDNARASLRRDVEHILLRQQNDDAA